jgi:hypothetical protein
LPVTIPETIVRRRCAALIPYARNARTHSDQQVAQIAASIREFGFTNPVLIDQEDGIIAGHGGVLGAHLLGLDEVPCIVLAHLTPTQRRGYVLADNKLALNAVWDLEMLSLEIGELGEAGFDLAGRSLPASKRCSTATVEASTPSSRSGHAKPMARPVWTPTDAQRRQAETMAGRPIDQWDDPAGCGRHGHQADRGEGGRQSSQ